MVEANTVLNYSLFSPFPDQQGADEGGQGAVLGQGAGLAHAEDVWEGGPAKDSLTIPKCKGKPLDLPHTSSILSRLTILTFDSHPYFSAHDSWKRCRATLALSAFPPGSVAVVWFEQVLYLVTSNEPFVDEFKDRFVSCGADL